MQTDTRYIVAPKGYPGEADFYTSGFNDQEVINNALRLASGSKSEVALIPGARYVIDPAVGIVGQDYVTFDMARAIITIANGTNDNGNIVKFEGKHDFRIKGCFVDGNRGGQISGTNYGLYIAGCSNYVVDDAEAINCRGVGVHIYDGLRGSHGTLKGSGNMYHAVEVEQCVLCNFGDIIGNSNDLDGLLVSPGEQGGSGTRYCNFGSVVCCENDRYGMSQNAANDDISAWLNEGNTFGSVVCSGNADYGLSIYKQDRSVFGLVVVAGNGMIGIYLHGSAYNTFSNVFVHDNSQAGDGLYDEIFLEGTAAVDNEFVDHPAHPSSNNQFRGGTVLIDASGNRARYGVSEASADDGNNVFDLNIPAAGTVAKTHILSETSIPPQTSSLPMIDNSIRRTMPDGAAGFDTPFNEVLRIINRMGGETQYINDEAAQTWYHAGVKLMGFETNDSVHIRADSATYDPTDDNMFGIWLDSGANLLRFRVKYPGGTVKAGSISLS